MKTNVFSEELLPACSVNNRTDLHSGSVFISSINAVMFIIAAIIRGRKEIYACPEKDGVCYILPELCHFT